MSESSTLRKALVTIKKLKQMLQEQKKSFEPIAIVGLSCRFAGANNKLEFWELLSAGKNAISHHPEERWQLLKNSEEFFNRDKNHPYWGSYIPNIPAFDAYFFGISPREAMRMDPQQRILLEVIYEAIEDSGITVDELAGSNTGVFASLYQNQFGHMQKLETDLDALYLPTGNAISMAANRVSYFFDLHGPSIVLDTACSSSLVALHLACLNIQNNLCDMALVCGANINLSPSLNLVLAQAKMLSPDGQCKTFDASANGYVQGEGVGAVVLKPLSAAIKNKDRIYAVINGSEVNQDGKTNGLTAPNGLQQEELIRSAFKFSDINPKEVSYVECHGTGTFLGDPIELQALGEVVGKDRDQQQPCFIGSVKTNLGHLEPAAGIASIIKVALSLFHSQIPPHLNFKTPNPHIGFEKYHLQVPVKMENWPKYGNKRIAGVSGFGFGGTNAHVVVRELTEEEKPVEEVSNVNNNEIFTLSAKDPEALKALIKKWSDFLENNPTLNLAKICYNVHMRRSHYFYRLAIVVSSVKELSKSLISVINLESSKNNNIYLMTENRESKNQDIDVNLEKIDLHQIANAYVNHANIDWKKLEEHRSYLNLDMPQYPWQHKDYWPPLKTVDLKINTDISYPFQGKQTISPLSPFQFEFQFDTKTLPEIKDTYNVLHVGFYLEMLGFAINQLQQQMAFTIKDFSFLLALIVPDNETVSVYLVLDKIKNDELSFRFYTFSEKQKWIEHANGKILLKKTIHNQLDPISIIKDRCTSNEPAEHLYRRVLDMGMPAGDSIRWTNQFWKNEKEILCEFDEPDSCKKYHTFKLGIHPGVFDGSIQPLFKLLPEGITNGYMGARIDKINYFGMQPGKLFLHANLKTINVTTDEITGDCCLLNEDNKKIIEFENLHLKKITHSLQIEKINQAKEIHESIDLSNLTSLQRKEYVMHFLTEQVAMIFSMPKDDVDINLSLKNMGIDSLMALVLSRTIEMAFKTPYSTQALLDGPSISELSDFILNNIHREIDKTEINNSWIAFRKTQKQPKIRLFCFPYGGGGASIYRDWQEGLSSVIEVCPIQLPGREERLNENPINNINVLIDELISHLKPEFNLPFAFFGHSLGALIAFELTRKLRKLNLSLPKHLFISAFPDPALPLVNLNKLLKQLDEIHIDLFNINPEIISKLSDMQFNTLASIFIENGLVEYGSSKMSREVLKVLLPIFSGDMSIAKSYKFNDESPLELPFTVFLGKQDQWVPVADLSKWVKHTKSKCDFHSFDAGHLFIKDPIIKQDILRKISAELEIERVSTMI